MPLEGRHAARSIMREIEVPVLICGGSLVGMSAALFLAQHGVRALSVEYHRGTAIHPRAALANQRTLELFRNVGLEQIICQRSAEQFVQNGGIVAVETLRGGTTEEFIADLNEGVRDVSPCERVFLSQNALEPLLKQRALDLGAEFRFATEVLSVEQDSSGVTARLRDRDSGEESLAHAKYAIAADGAHSRIRQQLGMKMQGHQTFSRSVTIYFRADLKPLLWDKTWAVVYVNHPQLRGFFRFEKPFESGFLVVNTAGDPDHPITDVSTGLTTEKALQYIRTALGTDSIPVTVENIMHWNARADVAERFRVGRIFLAGDSAHVMPPTGGFGGNTGVQDAHNLAWKLAMVLSGRAPEELLSTYEIERAPVAAFTVEQAYTRYVVRTAPDLKPSGMEPYVQDLNIELGYVYRSHAVIPTPDGPGHLHPRESHGMPGTRAPHVWLARGGERLSTLDLFGRNFTLLGGPAAQQWARCARAASADAGIALDPFCVGNDGLDDRGDMASAYGIEPSGCAIVRPDGFVGWRTQPGEPASAQRLSSVLIQLTCGTA
jgi:2-polyprenyl-6-methoxyphenol hydroxylase-like FAD-dependent oxidoreductase